MSGLEHHILKNISMTLFIYTQFVEDVVIDGNFGKGRFELSPSNPNLVFITIPAFWYYAGIYILK